MKRNNIKPGSMLDCRVIKIQTPKKFLLNGLFFGSEKARTVFIYVHGLGASLFSQIKFIEELVSDDAAVIAFNNRGHDTMSRAKRLTATKKGHESFTMGMAHEIFTDCIDDIEGAVNYACNGKAKKIFLVGHSTGCQKSAYYLAKRPKTKVAGAVFLGPMSDYAGLVSSIDKRKYKKMIDIARAMIKKGREHELLPSHLYDMPLDAQRFLSLYGKDSVEEIFGYASGRKPEILRSIKQRLLIVLAREDEFKDRPIDQIADWFNDNLIDKQANVVIVKGANHRFDGYEKKNGKMIRDYSNS